MKTRGPADAVLLGSIGLALLVCGGLLVYGAGRGADLTDEIFYLIWARDPDAYALVYQPFGYLLHPLFRLAHGDLRSYRLLGFAIAAGAGALLGHAMSGAGRSRLPPSLYGALAALTIFYPWIITPSYNSAANVGAMLVIAGTVHLVSPDPTRGRLGSVVAASGLCLAAFSKPPLFALAVVAMLVVAVVARRRPVVVAAIASLVLAAALASLFVSPIAVPGLLHRMTASQHILALPNTPLSLPAKIMPDWAAVPVWLTVATIAAALGLLSRRYHSARWAGYCAIACSLVYFTGIAPDAIDGALPDFVGLGLVTMTVGYAGVLGLRRDMFAIGLLLAAPFAVALGTFNNQWAQFNFSMAFPFLALFVLAGTDRVRLRSGVARAGAILGPVGVMLLAACYPYSLPASVFEQRIAIRHPLTQSAILVDPETADFVQSAHGLASGAVVVDLSGTGPGVVAALGGKAPVLPWLNPATGTWPDVVWSRLTPRERESAWFVGPVWPLFARSAPARWLRGHQSRFCGRALAQTPFWGEERDLIVWRPCRPDV